MIDDLRPLLKKLTSFAKDRLGFSSPPRLFLRKDIENSASMLGKTAHYDPQNKAVTVFVSNRHPKDILRSYCHELVHHCQNLRGDLAPEKMKTMNNNYAQENEHMRKMEEEAYLQGNMCFRDWEDGLDDKLQYRIKIAEQKFLKENNNMSVKITKQFLKETIEKLLNERVKRDSEDRVSGRRSGGRRVKPLEEEENLDEGGCGSHSAGKKEDKACPACGHRGGLHEDGCSEQGELTVDEAAMKDFPDVDGDGDKEEKISDAQKDKEEQEKKDQGMKTQDSEDSEGSEDSEESEESEEKKDLSKVPPQLRDSVAKRMNEKIKTPEQENKLYESRFSNRNSALFEKLVKKWTK